MSGLPDPLGPSVIHMPADRYLSTSEAASLLGVSRRTLSRMAAEGRLTPAVTIPGPQRVTYRWDADQLREQWQELTRRRER